MTWIIPVFSGKGGVGKTFTAANLAVALHAEGKTVGLIDLDITGANTLRLFAGKRDYKFFLVKPCLATDGMSIPVAAVDGIVIMSSALLNMKDGIPIAMKGEERRALTKRFLDCMLRRKYDYIVCDLPPATGDEIMPLFTDYHKYIKGAVIVTMPSDVAVTDVRKVLTYCNMKEIKVISLIVNQMGFKCDDCGCEVDLFSGKKYVDGMVKDFNISSVYSIPVDPELNVRPFYRNSELFAAAAKRISRWKVLL